MFGMEHVREKYICKIQINVETMMTSNFVLFPFLPSKFKGHNNIHYDSTL